ncbi:MAG: dihydrofolate reductase [Gammaproteobacteria bacterium]
MTIPIAIVAAIAKDNIIGKGGGLPWHIPEDLRHFRAITMGGALIMGRRTYDSIGKPLPGRLNIIVSRQSQTIEGCQTATSPTAALDIAKASGKNIFIIGGEQIYRQLLPQATILHLTDLTAAIAIENGDATFPPINKQEWQQTKSTPLQTTPNATFQTHHRITPH